MSINITCPNCKTKLLAKESLAGMRIACKKCRGLIWVPRFNVPEAAAMPLAIRHLQLRLRALNADLNRAIKARREATLRQTQTLEPAPGEATAAENEASVLVQLLHSMNPQAKVCISDAQVDFLMAEIASLCSTEQPEPTEADLRAEAYNRKTALPLDRLEFELPLNSVQMDAAIMCAAPEFDPGYEIIYAFILNDISRRLPCPELFLALGSPGSDLNARRLELGRFGRLRLSGIIETHGVSASELKQGLRLAP
jgi:hypothetical protein